MSRSHVMVRVMAHCASEEEAWRLDQDLLQALAAFDATRHGAPQRYWKMPELYEFSFAVAGVQRLPAITALCGRAWTEAGDETDPSWVWNAVPGVAFLHPGVVWAEVLTFEA